MKRIRTALFLAFAISMELFLLGCVYLAGRDHGVEAASAAMAIAEDEQCQPH